MGNSPDWFDRGMTLFAKRDLSGAITAFDKAILLNQSQKEAWYNRGLVFAQTGNSINALRSFDQTLSLDPGHEKAKKARTMILARMEYRKTRDHMP
jgi:eukaryotic-like serine/threonine-protein kinase